MLSIAISAFFAFAFFGATAVIAMMFLQYRDRIVNIIQNEWEDDQSGSVLQPMKYHNRTVKAQQLMTQHRSLQPVPLRVAA